MDDFLAKPINFGELSNVLSKWLSADSATHATATPVRVADIAITPDSAAPDFDETAMLRLFAGNRDLARMVIQSAVETMPKHLDSFEQMVATKNWKDAERAAHTLRGVAGQVGGVALARHLQRTETLLFNGERTSLAEVAVVRRKYATLAQALQPWLE